MIKRAAYAAAASMVAFSVLAGCQPGSAAQGAGARGAAAAGSGPAVSALDRLPVRADATIRTYRRVQDFGQAWMDNTSAPGGHDGCDTRDDILRRDLTGVRLHGRCEVASGVLHDPYTGQTISFRRGRTTSEAVQIDHMVSLGNAWQTGAAALSQATREELANDPLNLEAVQGTANQEKGDDDASRWLPPATNFRCQYVARQIAVKAKYRLWLAPAEQRTMRKVLGDCPGQTLPTELSTGVMLKS